MIKIHSLIHELYVRKAQKEGNNCPSIFEAHHYRKATQSANGKNSIGIIAHWFYPLKAIK